MSTPAVKALQRAGLAFVLHEYEVETAVGEGYGEAVAAELGAPPEQVFKTLMAVADGEHVVAVVPVAERLSTKALARAAGAKKAWMADPADAERLTGYVSGGISPFGQRRSLRTFLDETAMLFSTVLVSAGRRGVQVEVSPVDLLAATGGVSAPLV